MPYIKDEIVRKNTKISKRKEMDVVVDLMVKQGVRVDGDLNYILYKFCKCYILPSYNNYKNFCGELDQCITEIKRRLIVPYEDEKIRENGDVD